jgi:hypothetical protein
VKIFAYCCQSFRDATRRAAGVIPLTSPPVDAATFGVWQLEGNDFIWFDLHGEPGLRWWLGDNWIVALTAAQVREVDLGGAVVFAVNCYLADEDSPMLEALLDAGARYVVGGTGRNWAGQRTLFGAGLLGMRFLYLMSQGRDPLHSLALAKRWMRLGMAMQRVMGKSGKVMAAKDALTFRAYYRNTDRQDLRIGG